MRNLILLIFLLISVLTQARAEDYYIYFSVSTCKLNSGQATDKIMKELRHEGHEKCYELGLEYLEVEWSISLMNEKNMCGGMAGNLVFRCLKKTNYY
ncbi:MAG: hypothetical protein H6622_15140 [Halobacteriovoraceae bacterium]|nr:hypothetical protein [Halobacteriovoraceae bacterium]